MNATLERSAPDITRVPERIHVHFALYRNGELWASLTHPVNLAPGTTESYIMAPDRYAHSYIRLLMIANDPDPREGWANLRVQVDAEGQPLGDGCYQLPLSVFIGHPTDWTSGVARFPDRGWPDSRDPELKRPGVWTLTARRAY